MYYILFFVLGLIFGSFYVNLGIRLCKKESIVYPPSHCDNCGHKLKFYELIPVFSYIFLRGKCASCNKKIDITYPVLELFTAVLFVISFYIFDFKPELFIALLLSSVFIVIMATDLNYYIIPDSIIVITGVLIFIYNIIVKGVKEASIFLVYGLIMFIFIYALMLLGNLIFKKESLGGGDVKLVGILGMLFPPMLSFLSLSLGALLALPVAIFLSIKRKDNILPFGPFIVIAFLIVFLSGLDAHTVISYLTF